VNQRRQQATIATEVKISGNGVHSGVPSEMAVRPGGLDTGILFIVNDDRQTRIKVSQDNVRGVEMCTQIGSTDVSVAVTEHLMAAFRICGITNAEVEITAGEVPIMDGSAAPFIAEFRKSGIKIQDGYVPVLYIEDEIMVTSGRNGYIRVMPSDTQIVSVRLMLGHGRTLDSAVSTHTFSLCEDLEDIACARTFGWFEDFEKIKARGLALGASFANTVALGRSGEVLNKGGLRSPKELVMHKCLDFIGDLAVLGIDVIGRFECVNPSHFLNNELRMALLLAASVTEENTRHCTPLSRPKVTAYA
jgi:UDP-3-O-[3-hydroxymyristoyl] N-acetylglucosamine deacetylase